ncbi:hypothetical protein H4S14_003944 [Agrobacterium vitis]|nr:hypothetical protein [Agrobacterium vitis]MBE1440173.1 hypothetical protein [Agrobacterium vitis]
MITCYHIFAATSGFANDDDVGFGFDGVQQNSSRKFHQRFIYGDARMG